jgi:hypothetical protein
MSSTFRKVLTAATIVVCVGMSGWSQPQYSTNFLTTVSPSSIPFNSTTNNRVQWVFYPSDFATAPAGSITKIYFKRQPSMLPVISSYTNLTIKMGETSLSAIPPGPWITAGMVTVFQANTYDFLQTPGDWMPVTLQTPFNYTGTTNFIVEVTHGGFSVGFEVMQANLTGRSVYGSSMSVMSNPQNVLADFGFDIGTGGTDVSVEGLTGVQDTICSGSYTLSAMIQNHGPATLHTVTINRKINNVLLSPVYWNGILAANATVTVSLGTSYFASGTPYTVTVWTSNPNNQADPNPYNDTATLLISHVYQAPTVIPATTSYNICEGDSVQLSGTLSGIPPWNLSMSDGTTVYHLQNLTTPSYGLWVSPSINTIYTFQSITDGSGCPGTLPPPVQVSVRPIPVVDIGQDQTIKMSDSVQLTAVSSGVTYLWSTGATTPSIWVKGADYGPGPHLFSVTVTTIYNCKGSDSATVSVIDDTGMEEMNLQTHFTIRPNPSGGEVELYIVNRRPTIVEIEVLGLDGKVRHRQWAELSLGNQTIYLDLRSLPDGVYLIRLRGDQLSTVKKLVIRK